MAGERRIGHSADEWRQLIEEQRGNGQSQDAFCAARGLSKSTLQAWKRRLYGSSGTAAPATTAPVRSRALSALFTPLPRPVAGPAPSASGWTIELDLGDGLCLRLRRGA